MRTSVWFGAAALGCVIACPSAAHVGLSPTEAPTGQAFLISVGIGHGCDGAATTVLRVQMPAGVISVQPVPKPGWTIEIVSGPYAAPQMQGATEVREGVTELRWTGGNLPNAFYDQFVFRARLADNLEHGTMVWFPVIQECATGIHRWITVPVEGQPEPAEPTPGLMVAEPTEGGHAH